MEDHTETSEDENSETSVLPTEEYTPFLEEECKHKYELMSVLRHKNSSITIIFTKLVYFLLKRTRQIFF